MGKKSTFLPYHVKKNHSTLEVDTFKVMLLLSYLAHDFKSPLLGIEIIIFLKIFENFKYIFKNFVALILQ